MQVVRSTISSLLLMLLVLVWDGDAVADPNSTSRESIGIFKDVGSGVGRHNSNNHQWSKLRIRVSIRKWNTVYSVYWGDYFPWYLTEGQIKAESNYNQYAVSPVGAKGLGQFMPNTWLEVSKALGYDGSDVFSPSLNIQATIWYTYRLRSVYKAPRPEEERHSMALCSYNAGLGNCIKAQRLCNDTLLWSEAKACLPDVTGHHSTETITYINRIWEYSDEIKDNSRIGW